ncbi:hypothetical protein HMPREF0526_10952 [Lactobacillus jensenii JV-V16]|nr:hypothetical protein HMPREF0526_10952 [Lactobacillus jensenii JV-V16]
MQMIPIVALTKSIERRKCFLIEWLTLLVAVSQFALNWYIFYDQKRTQKNNRLSSAKLMVVFIVINTKK